MLHHCFQEVPHFMKKNKNIVPVVGLKSPPKRIAITPCVIKSAKSKILFAQGKEKGCILSKALENPDDVVSLPVRLVLGETFVLDTAAYEQLDLNKIT